MINAFITPMLAPRFIGMMFMKLKSKQEPYGMRDGLFSCYNSVQTLQEGAVKF